MNYYVSFILFLNVTLLSILVPGGPIENRDFSKLKGVVFWGFNIFLISLGVMTYVTSYWMLKSSEFAVLGAKVVSVLYFLVYALDLGKIFPKSPTEMSKTLMLLEIVNMSLAVYLFILAITM
ncbi:hypothetical protein [Fusibacter ferrireducens]|uniref:DUF8051 domain-containing protein n=1 Tax=Fusibacter ferrireducens TaxID=2785058 RepID=A0ABR9ZX77_9FIRM|nr:hypothetical protein [Fusibacter ferrireducens]MBF4694561.1 hypothetical protein [Fusibacter ferrireducens]